LFALLTSVAPDTETRIPQPTKPGANEAADRYTTGVGEELGALHFISARKLEPLHIILIVIHGFAHKTVCTFPFVKTIDAQTMRRDGQAFEGRLLPGRIFSSNQW
jgi:hypothetical protein